MHPLIKIAFEAESFIFTSFYSISDGVTLQVTLLCHTTVVLFPVYARKNFLEGTNLAANLAVFKPCFANAVFSVRCIRVSKLLN